MEKRANAVDMAWAAIICCLARLPQEINSASDSTPQEKEDQKFEAYKICKKIIKENIKYPEYSLDSLEYLWGL